MSTAAATESQGGALPTRAGVRARTCSQRPARVRAARARAPDGRHRPRRRRLPRHDYTWFADKGGGAAGLVGDIVDEVYAALAIGDEVPDPQRRMLEANRRYLAAYRRHGRMLEKRSRRATIARLALPRRAVRRTPRSRGARQPTSPASRTRSRRRLPTSTQRRGRRALRDGRGPAVTGTAAARAGLRRRPGRHHSPRSGPAGLGDPHPLQPQHHLDGGPDDRHRAPDLAHRIARSIEGVPRLDTRLRRENGSTRTPTWEELAPGLPNEVLLKLAADRRARSRVTTRQMAASADHSFTVVLAEELSPCGLRRVPWASRGYAGGVATPALAQHGPEYQARWLAPASAATR